MSGNSWRAAARKRTDVRCHATAAPANCHAPAASRRHARYASNVPPTAIAMRAGEACPDKRRRETEQAEHQPAARYDCDQPGGGSIHGFRALQILFERFVFAVVPAIGRELRQAGAMPGHALDQIVRHGEANVGPDAVALEISPGDRGRNEKPHQEQRRLQNAPGAGSENKDRDDDFDERDQREKSTAQRERFHRFGFKHASEQLPGALMAKAVGIQAQRAEERPLFQERARADGDPALQSRDEHAQRDQRQQQQRPGNEPAAIRPAAQDIAIRPRTTRESRAGTEPRGRWRARASRRGICAWRSCSQKLAPGGSRNSQMPRIRLELRRSRRMASRARACFAWRDLGAVERFLNLAQDGRFEDSRKAADRIEGGIYANFR